MSIAILTSNENGANSLIDINANFADLDTTKADLDSPTFTGTPVLPTGTTGVTQSASDNSTKLATTAYVDAAASSITIETTTGTTHSLTTIAGQKVIVWVKGDYVGVDSGGRTITLKYDGVTKDTVNLLKSDSGTNTLAFALQYTETPGATTKNITVEANSGSPTNVVIIVMKIG